ncbi:MAG: hypothetical protein L0H23_07620 [Luteimonas sp.]|nr:hypothetical protein [Luteimonas sp.]
MGSRHSRPEAGVEQGDGMTEQTTSSGEKDWGNLRFTPRRGHYMEGSPEDNANSRFLIGLVVFVVVALLYPWYSYQVQTRLAARDLTRVVEAVDFQVRSELKAVEGQARQAAQRSQATVDRRRVAAVRVVGAMATSGKPVVIVNMGEAGLSESRATICRQASRWLKRSTSGMTLQVQSHRERLPAVSIGSVDC